MPPKIVKTDHVPDKSWITDPGYLRLVGYRLCVNDDNEVYPEFTWMYDVSGGEPSSIINGGAPQDLWLDSFNFLHLNLDENPNNELVKDWMAVFVSTVRVPKDLGANRDEHEFEPVTKILWARKK